MVKKLLQVGVLLAVFISIPAGAVPCVPKASANGVSHASVNGIANGKGLTCDSAGASAAIASSGEVGVPTVKVPEPSLVGLLAMGLVSIGIARRLVKV